MMMFARAHVFSVCTHLSALLERGVVQGVRGRGLQNLSTGEIIVGRSGCEACLNTNVSYSCRLIKNPRHLFYLAETVRSR
jgi:hypothetical protein